MVAMPDTPEKPLSKKTKREETGMNTTTGHSESNMDILAAIHKLSLKHDATFQKIFTIEKITQATSREIDSLFAMVKQLVIDVSKNKKRTAPYAK